jgi:hypothetical protein
MSNVLVFTPKHELEFQKNYDEFISFSKNKLTLFNDYKVDGKSGWDCDKWSWETDRRKKLSIIFGVPKNGYNFMPYQSPFADFAKAYVRYHQSLNFKNATMWASPLLWIYKALEKDAKENNKSSIDLMNLSNSIVNQIENSIKSSDLSAGGKRNVGQPLASLLKFLKEKRIKIDLQDWKNPFPRPSDSRLKLDDDSINSEQDKCPSDFKMLQVADAFHKAKTPKQKYYTSLLVMLTCQPSRSVELKGLTINSLQKSDKGRWYLMWNPAKGGDPVRKWIPELLEDVVKEAFDRLISISRPAREAARFAFDNPDDYMIHGDCITSEYHSQDEPLTIEEFSSAFGIMKSGKTWISLNSEWSNNLINELNGTSDWKKELLGSDKVLIGNQVCSSIDKKPLDIKIIFPSYKDLRKYVDKTYKTKSFPKYGNDNVWDCITLSRENEFHKSFIVKPFSWVLPSHSMMDKAFGFTSLNYDGLSIFEELALKDEDGSPLYINTHQPRHWLNTKLKLAGVEDWLIAKWSGRADVKQNKEYDGRTQGQKSRLTKRIGLSTGTSNALTVSDVSQALEAYSSDSPPPPVLLVELGLPVSLKSLGINREGVAQFTGLGFCVHNYAESPCVKSGDCATCSDHVCLKGIPNTMEELESLQRLYEEQLERAESSVAGNVFGADRWVTSLGFRLAKIKTIILMMKDSKIPEEMPIRIPNDLNPSPIKRSLVSGDDLKNKIHTKVFDLAALALSDLGE